MTREMLDSIVDGEIHCGVTVGTDYFTATTINNQAIENLAVELECLQTRIDVHTALVVGGAFDVTPDVVKTTLEAYFLDAAFTPPTDELEGSEVHNNG